MTTTAQTTSPDNTSVQAVDEALVEAFVGQLLTDFAGASTTAMTVVGDRLGLYAAMAGAGPLTSPELAAATGLHPRLLTEWLASQTVSGYVTYDPRVRTYELPPEHAVALSVVDSPAYLVGCAEIITGQYLTLDLLSEAFRGDGGLDYADLPRCLHTGIERFFHPVYLHQLADSWFPAVKGLVAKLELGASVADVGSGHGLSTLQMAARWPQSTFSGFDLDHTAVVMARSKAIEAGYTDNVSFVTSDAVDIGPGPYNVVTFFDALHDMGDPPAALRRARDMLVEEGLVVVVEPWSLDRLEDGIGNPSVRIDYSCSTSLCTPGSLGQPGAYGLGTQGGPTRRLQLLRDAGFAEPELVADTGANLVFAATKRS